MCVQNPPPPPHHHEWEIEGALMGESGGTGLSPFQSLQLYVYSESWHFRLVPVTELCITRSVLSNTLFMQNSL